MVTIHTRSVANTHVLTPVMVKPESARAVMEAYTAADLSAERNEPVDLPLTNETIAAVADFKAKFRTGDNVAVKA